MLRENRQRVIRLLVMLLLLECAAYAVLRTSALYPFDRTLRWIVNILLFSLPPVVFAALLFRRRLRFGLRSLLVGTALLALFFGWSFAPLIHFRQQRRLTIELKRAGAFDDGELVQRTKRQDVLEELPFWLREFCIDIARYPPADELEFLQVSSLQQLDFVRERLDELPNVRGILFERVRDLPVEEVRSLIAAVGRHTARPRALIFRGQPPRVGHLPVDQPLEYLGFVNLGAAERPEENRLRFLQRIRPEAIHFLGTSLTSAEIDQLVEAEPERLRNRQLSEAQRESLRRDLPECEFDF